MSCIDLLPVELPYEDNNPPTELDFYNNVVKELILDVIKLQYEGIPINLDKVSEVENTVNNVLISVKDRLAHNKIMLAFLINQNKLAKEAKTNELKAKEKSYTEFITEYNPKNKIHRSYLVNYILDKLDMSNMKLQEWSIKDIKKVNTIINSNLLNKIISDNYIGLDNDINEAMINLAKDKAEIYNKSKIDAKIEALDTTDLINEFNPGSSKQKQEFFNYYEIESESETSKGMPQWNRAELTKLKDYLTMLIEGKENETVIKCE